MKKSIIKNLIKNIVSEESEYFSTVMSKAYRCKNNLYKSIYSSMKSRIQTIETQNEYEAAIDEEIEKLRSDIDLTLGMIARYFYKIPFQHFKQNNIE